MGDTTVLFFKEQRNKESRAAGTATAAPAPAPGQVRDNEMTVFEMLEYRENLSEKCTDFELLWGVLSSVSLPGGEKNPEWQKHKIMLRELMSRLITENGIWLDPEEAETLYYKLTD